MLLRPVYKANLVTVVVDEVHCVQTWGNEFRVAYAEKLAIFEVVLSLLM